MRCCYCNSRLAKRNNFCPKCGAEIVKEETKASDAMPRGIRVLIVIGVLLLIAVVTCGVLIFTLIINNTQPTGTTNTEAETTAVAFSENLEAIAASSKAVVKLNCYDKKGDLFATGSGFSAFEEGVIVTNYHVIKDRPARIELVTESGQKCDIVGVVGVAKNRDIVILYYYSRTAGFELPLLQTQSSGMLQKGEKVVAIGSPLGLTNVVSTGVFSGYTNISGSTDIQFTASISSGSSGGALFNDKGDVIGITYASFEAGQNLNLAVPIVFVESLWESESKDRSSLYEYYNELDSRESYILDLFN